MISKKLIILVSFMTFQANAQEVENLYQQELNKMVKIPNSPEAQAFAKYGDYNVSMYSGTPNIAVPLYTFKGREMDLPISLSYDATGIKVEQLATWVGLGWNLNIGGRITRRVNGLPDDYIQGNYLTTNDGRTNQRKDLIAKINSYLGNTSKVFSGEQKIRDYFMFLDDINKNYIDAQPDVFTISAPGLSTTIVFDMNDNNQPKSLDNPRIKVNAVYRGYRGNKEITGWQIINEDGTIYYFGNTPYSPVDAYETTLRNGSDLTDNGVIINEYVSSWLLTEIISSNNKDRYQFNYFDDGYWPQDMQASAASMATVTLRDFETYYSTNEVAEQFGRGAGYSISQQFLSSILHNGHVVGEVQRGNRYDIDTYGTNTRLSSINIYDYNKTPLRTFTFLNDSYFNDDANTSLDWRLKLDGIHIKDADQAVTEEYIFEYDRPNSLPSRNSRSQDFAGYFNGAFSNQHLFERYEAKSSQGNIIFDGANREPNNNYAKIGTLQKITYPTGGSTVFEFEGNLSSEVVKNQVKIYDLSMSIYPSDRDNNAFYLDENGSAPDYKYSADGFHPKIKRQRFRIDQSSSSSRKHTLNFYGSAPNTVVDAYIFKIDDDFSGRTFSDYLDTGADEIILNKITNKNFPLEAGEYVAVVLMDELEGTGNKAGGPQYGNIILTITHQEAVFNNQDIDQGGMRIASIKNYESDGNFSNGKSYEYVEQNPRNIRPALTETKTLGGESVLMRRVFQTQADDRISYSRVREYQIDQDGGYEGYVESKYFTEPGGLVPGNGYPYESNYHPTLKGGTLRHQDVFNGNEEKVSAKDYEYFETYNRPIKLKGLTVINDDEYLGHYIYIRDNGNGTYGYDYVSAIPCSGGNVQSSERGFTFGGGSFCVPHPCLNGFDDCGEYIGFLDRKYGGLNFKETTIYGAYGGISVQKDTLFYNDASNNPLEHTTSSATTYEMDTGYYLPVETKTVDSKGKIFRQVLTYPSTGGSEYTSLLSKNNLVEVVASKREMVNENGSVEKFISARKNEYFSSGRIVLPSKVLTSKTSENDLEERMGFNYFTNGNIKESKATDGPMTTYIWGYNNMYPVAKVENATYQQVDSLKVNNGVLQDLSSSEDSKLMELGKIRSGLPNAMVTTYTYEPLVGVTSITDPRGYTSRYHYDGFNRLSYISDAEDYVVKKYNYNYTGQQQQGYPTLAVNLNSPSAGLLNGTPAISASVSGGTGSLHYTWSVNDQPLADNDAQLNHVFESPGATDIKLKVTDANTGIVKTATTTIMVHTPIQVPTLTTSTTHVLVDQNLNFTTGNITGGSTDKSYEWYIDNTKQTGSTTTTFSKAFKSPGTYTVRFRVRDNAIPGHYNENSMTINVYNPLTVPTVNSDQTYVLKNTGINFTTGTIGGGSGNRSYEWYVGNTKQATTGSTFSYTPSLAGTYTIKFRVKDNVLSGHYKEGVKTVYAYNPLTLTKVAPNKTYVLHGTNITFNTSGIGGGSGNRQYEWYVNNTKQSGTGASLIYKPTSPGTYTVKFKIIDTRIASHSLEKTATVYAYNPLNTPILSSNKTYVIKGTTIGFTTGNIGNGSGQRKYEWYVNNIKQSNTTGSFSYTPTTSGTYTVKFRVVDTRIASHYKEKSKTVYAYNSLTTPNLYSNKTYLEKGNTASFTTSGIGGGSGNRRYEWYVNNAKQSATGTGYTRSFSSSGTYTIKFRVIDNNTGQAVERTKTVYVYNPMATGSISAPSSVTVNNNAAFNINPSSGSGSYSYSWTISTPWKTYTSTAKSFTLNMNYDYYGNRSVSCKVTDTKTGISRTATRSITVGGAPTLRGKFSSTTLMSNSYYRQYRITATPLDGSGHYTYKWYIDGGTKVISTAKNYTIYLDCSNKSDRLVCHITDIRTGKTATVNKIYSFSPSCGSSSGSKGTKNYQ